MSQPQVVVTRAAAERETEHWFWGKRVFGELLGNETLTGMGVLAATGRRFAPDDIEVVDHLAVLIAFADPRIWPITIAWTVASYGSYLAAIGAGSIPLEGGLIGPWNCGDAARTIGDVRTAIGDAIDDEAATRAIVEAHFAGRERITGFGVPLRKIDERMVGLREIIARLGRERRPAWRTMEAIAAALFDTRKLEANFAMGVAAALLDMDCTPTQISVLAWWLQLTALMANSVEGVEQGLELFRHFPAEWVDYQGAAPRESPRARAARGG